ncbi:retrovirus-related pol polyprotein from transposon TNT 1-94 [Tanacetum coccineum]|uniref:Retrovirus-related pol polyprotein from transposon TNT 1-94 n=1 Tax=Tanacetum coccineum TaxID=301880 RepID=A0ABQ4XBD8_9ASTR
MAFRRYESGGVVVASQSLVSERLGFCVKRLVVMDSDSGGGVIDGDDHGITPVAIIDRKLPFEYTIASRSTDVMVVCQVVYDAHNKVACIMLGSMTPELHRQFENSPPYEMLQELKSRFEKQTRVERFDLIQTFHACKQEEGKSVGSYVIKMKGYVEQLERLGYVLPQDLSVGLILNSLTSDIARFVRNYNMHNIGKMIGELHALLIEHEKGLPKKAATPQVLAIQGGSIQKSNKKSRNAKGKGKGKGKGKDKPVYIPKPKNPKPSAKEHPTKDDICHHCKEVGHWKRNCPAYLVELIKKKKKVSTASSSGFFTIELFSFPNKSWVYDTGCVSKNNVLYFNVILHDGIYEIDMLNLVPNVNSIYNVSNKRVRHNLDSTYLWHYRLAHISKKRTEKLQHDGLLKQRMMNPLINVYLVYRDYALESTIRILNMVPTKKALVKRDTPVKLQQRSVKCIFVGYPKETIEVSRKAGEFKEIQDEDTSPSENTSKILAEVEGFEPPQEEEAPVRRSVRTHRAPERLCLNVEVEEHSLGDLNELTNYKAELLDLKSDKWLDAMNAEMQSMKDN